MTPAQLDRKLRRLARKGGFDYSTVAGANHTKVTFNSRRTVVPRHSVDIKSGTYSSILKDLGLTPSDLE